MFFQQVAAGLEAVSNSWSVNAYALVPVSNTEQRLNNADDGGSLDTHGLNAGCNITPDIKVTIGYHPQNGDMNTADGSGVHGRLSSNISNGLTAGINLSHDQAFDTRFSADLRSRFGPNGYGAPNKQQPAVTPVIQALTASPTNRDVRVHDVGTCHVGKPGCCYLNDNPEEQIYCT